jgi:hypothetical protein
MALHRDIFWVGRQWAVTGSGIQAVDQRRRSEFDIEIARLWDDGLCDGLRAQAWFQVEDFEKALTIARARYPAPPRKPEPLDAELPKFELPKSAPTQPEASEQRVAIPAEPAQVPLPEAPPVFMWRIERVSAKFVRPWRVLAARSSVRRA